ncbi:Mut7-C ubiquitin/RNAse domain-containing protein [Corallococcus sp. M34]|uniref:Mut7-C ubiquitin/RNAse domain-containing protein n=1 Tax=Citreicoccus inhibens TaxID=2849499 RepID=UPI001C22B7EF|nr:Mut7-C ubiquitin/RNAse domain-containing protein [Citreicoccus inhibens]MBU8895737.1 Mut7-C ubiquitin/RNAse domain-containing protein [Citreicoccus inhibens]
MSEPAEASRAITVRFHGALNDFLPAERRDVTFTHVLQGSPSAKDLIESLGPPHPEVDVILVNGVAVNFSHRMEAGMHLIAAPAFHPVEVPEPALRVGPPLPDLPRFVLDVGLGRLAGFLRMLGFDTLWRNDFEDDELARISHDESRVVLTRDLGVLKRSEVVLGYFPRATEPSEQLVEVVRRFALTSRMHPFSRCIPCNGPLAIAEPHAVKDQVPEGVAERHTCFQQCPDCRRVFWPGTHHQRMEAIVDALRAREQTSPPRDLAEPTREPEPPAPARPGT